MGAKFRHVILLYILSCIFFYLNSLVTCIFHHEESSQRDAACYNSNFIVVATVDGTVTAVDLDTGKKCWSVLLDKERFVSSTLSKLEIFEKGRRLFLVPSLDGGVYKYDNFQHIIKPLPIDIDSFISHSVYLDSSTAVLGGKVKIMHGVHRVTGEILYTCTLSGCNNFHIPFPENILVIEEVIKSVNAVDSSKAEQKWNFRVVELKIKLSSQLRNESSSEFPDAKEETALLPRLNDFSSLDIFKISLQSGFAGMINKTNEDFVWQFKTPCPINEAWYIKDDVIQMLDPFEKESGFFSIDMDNGKEALLFLGTYENQMFIKRSKKIHWKNMNLNSLSKDISYHPYIPPACPDSKNMVTPNPEYEEDLISNIVDYADINDHGMYFYSNFSIAENSTHCIINTSYIVHFERPRVPVAIWMWTSFMCLFVMFLWISWVCKKPAMEKEYCNASTYYVAKPLDDPSTNLDFTSRFFQDFEMISVLGKGGFGIVMVAKNKIDDCHYAVKRICLGEKFNSTQYERVLREVKALAKLDHHGIVRYFNAWIEHPPVGWQEKKDIESNIKYASETSETSDEEESSSKSANSSVSNIAEKLGQNPFQPFNDIFSDNIDFNGSKLSDYSSSEDCDSNSDSFIKFEKPNISHEDSQTSETHKNFKKLSSSTEYVNDSKFSAELCNEDDDDDDDSIKFCKLTHSTESTSTVNNIDSSFEVKKKHSKCYKILHCLNESMAHPLSSENFYVVSSFLFNCKTSSESSVEMSKWENTEKTLSTDELLFYQKWIICILCMIKSSKSFTCTIVLKKLYYILFKIDNKLQNCVKSKTECIYISSPQTTENKIAVNQENIQIKEVPRGYLYIQMQLCQEESLRVWLNRHSDTREYGTVIKIFSEIVDAVDYVHNSGLMHRDLKPSNIYFSLDGAIKIGDFGLATSSAIQSENNLETHSHEMHTSDIGTELYMSPEQKLKQDYDCKTDIYSLGIIFFELLVPFKTYYERCKVISKVRKLDFPEEFKRDFQNESQFVELLLDCNPKRRPSTNDMKQHPLLLQYASNQK